MASVTYKHVTKRWGDVVAVNDLDIHIEDKEFLVFVGPSGCGKSTSLRLLAGLDEITEGRILIGDRVVNDVPPKDRDIAMVFQSYALYPHMDVYDNMAFGLKLRGTPREEIKQRVEKAADILGIHSLLDRKPKQLSGGRAKRLPDGRAPVEPRRQAPRSGPCRDQQAPSAPGDDLHLRDPRPGRGDDYGHSHRCAQ